MKTTHTQTTELAVTDRVSLLTWKGLTRLEIVETPNTSVEISGIDTEELVLAISYLLRNLTQDAERSETITRRLNDISNDLKVLTKVEA
jgi:hypothetical protein